jgi:hypothetical protein
MHSTAKDKEPPLPPSLRTYTLLHTDGANSRSHAVVPNDSSSALYTTTVAAVIDLHHPNSLILKNNSSTTVGAVRMYHGCETINMAFGDPEDFARREACVWEDMEVKKLLGKATSHTFRLGLGDESRREFEWRSCHDIPTSAQSGLAAPEQNHEHLGRTHSWSISEHVHGLSRTHSWGLNGSGKGTKEEAKSAGNGHKHFKLVDMNDGEMVAMFVHDEGLEETGALGKKRGKFIVFRDFWKSGIYEEDWDKAVLLSGLAVLERSDRE